MGVEYKHFLIPGYASFVPGKDVLKKIDDVLIRWNLKTGNPKLYNLTGGENTNVINDLDNLDFGQGLSIQYPGVNGISVAKLMGRSLYFDEVPDEDRYIDKFILVVGLDYRIHPSSEEITITVKDPPFEDGVPVESYCEYDELNYGMYAEAYNCSMIAVPPKVDIWVADKKRIIGEQSFSGYWRTAFCIDCGKDQPWIDDELYTIPNREFIADFENALGSRIIEIGEFY